MGYKSVLTIDSKFSLDPHLDFDASPSISNANVTILTISIVSKIRNVIFEMFVVISRPPQHNVLVIDKRATTIDDCKTTVPFLIVIVVSSVA